MWKWGTQRERGRETATKYSQYSELVNLYKFLDCLNSKIVFKHLEKFQSINFLT
jgi:hypothetical protein